MQPVGVDKRISAKTLRCRLDGIAGAPRFLRALNSISIAHGIFVIAFVRDTRRRRRRHCRRS